MKVVIIDYGMGNLRSIQRSFQRLGVQTHIGTQAEDIEGADKLVLPGVGHFYQGMQHLTEKGMINTLNEKVLHQKVPVLGICLGMQLMGSFSEEGKSQGLGWVNADIKLFKMEDQLRYKVPHIGWNNLNVEKNSRLMAGISEDKLYYFVHSYYMKCHNPEDILGTTQYEQSFTAAIERENIFGTQFHPEKSREGGDQILTNFINL